MEVFKYFDLWLTDFFYFLTHRPNFYFLKIVLLDA